jgi:hypothetical protein
MDIEISGDQRSDGRAEYLINAGSPATGVVTTSEHWPGVWQIRGVARAEAVEGSEGINRLVDAEKTKRAGQEEPQAQVPSGTIRRRWSLIRRDDLPRNISIAV